MATNLIDCYIKLPSGKTLTFNLIPSDTIQKLCVLISEGEGVSSDRVNLKYQGKVLQKQHTLGYLGVCKETILKAEIIQIKQLNIFVKLPTGKTVSVNIENVSPLRYIKDAIESKEGIAPSQQVLKISDRPLVNPNQRCMDAGITNECILKLEIIDKPEKKPSGLNKKSKKGYVGSTSSISDSDSENREKPKGTSASKQEVADDVDDNTRESVIGTFDAMGRNVEVAFCFDTTGSMYSCLTQVRNKLKETVTKLLQEIPNIKIAIMAQGDYCDYLKYVVKYVDFTTDVDSLVEFASDVQATGGGDSPECYEWSLKKAQQLDWSENSAKAFVLIGDDVPHPPSYTDQSINWHEETDMLKAQGVKVYGIRAQHNSYCTPFFQEISEQTGGAYIEFKNFKVITEMFLAVCYKEAGNEQFEQFCEEMAETEKEESTKEDVKDILKQIDEAETKKNDEKPKRYVNAPWWDPKLDNTKTPQYSYNANLDEWKLYGEKSNKSGARVVHTRSPEVPAPHAEGCVHGRADEAPITKPITLGLNEWAGGKESNVFRRFSLRKKSRPASATASSDKKSCIVM